MNSLYCCIHFLVISFTWYKEYIIWWISFSKFSDVLPAFTCARAIYNIWSICLGANILRVEAKSDRCPFPLIGLYLASDAIEE